MNARTAAENMMPMTNPLTGHDPPCEGSAKTGVTLRRGQSDEDVVMLTGNSEQRRMTVGQPGSAKKRGRLVGWGGEKVSGRPRWWGAQHRGSYRAMLSDSLVYRPQHGTLHISGQRPACGIRLRHAGRSTTARLPCYWS